jgi:hypothetical protein
LSNVYNNKNSHQATRGLDIKEKYLPAQSINLHRQKYFKSYSNILYSWFLSQFCAAITEQVSLDTI